MCGIAGILGRVDKRLVGRMCDRIAHRGPDGQGVWTDEGVTLGHRRLSIIDVEGGLQPMESHDGRYVLIFNGEIYNHSALRQELEKAGCGFKSDHSDTEVLLEGYRHWGVHLFGRLEGMYAFALWDSELKELVVARDPFGIKPFFYACVDEEFVFASEVKALYAHPEIAFVPDVHRIKERAALDFLTGQGTLFQGIHQLPPGSFAILRPGADYTCHIPWQPHYTVPAEEFGSIEDAARAIKDRFVASVVEQQMSDVPLGVILSGGLDSAIVAQVQADRSDKPIQTFTVAESTAVEDFRQARRLAEEVGADHHETFFDLDDLIAGMPHYAWHNESINYTEFFFMPLFEMMSKHVKVGLCGQGSDEMWGGYDRYREPLKLGQQRIKRIRSAHPTHEEELATQVALTHSSGSSLAEFDQLGGQLNNFQLRLVDRNSMAHGVEVRVPFLSKPLHRASRAIGWEHKMRGGVEKWIFRHAIKDLGLPDDLVWRKKVPAGRATAPGVMGAFDNYADKLLPKTARDKHALAGTFNSAADQLAHDVWQETFVRDGKLKGIALEDFA
jgi:asparagine synthase (glutamine-hydrolysing)